MKISSLIITISIILIILIIFPKIYNRYIIFRSKEMECIRIYIKKHFKDNYIYLPSIHSMIYNFNYPVRLNYWIDFTNNKKREFDKKTNINK